MGKYILVFSMFLILNCGNSPSQIQTNTQKAQTLPQGEMTESNQQIEVEKFMPLAEIDLSKIGHIAPVERVQDKEENQLKVVEDLIANGKNSIPFLIGKLQDATKVEGRPMDFWGEITVGDIAHIILSDFFHRKTGEPTIKGVGFYEFLDCKNPKETPANNCFYVYIEKHGRKSLKAKWQRIWEQNKDKIYWDENERCFNVKTTVRPENLYSEIIPCPAQIKCQTGSSKVIVQVFVSGQGKIVAASAVAGDKKLREFGEKLAREKKFEPQFRDGQAYEYSGIIDFTFK